MPRADDIRGSGLMQLDQALVALVENPQRLDLMRRRFSNSPQSSRSHRSGTTTRSQCSNEPSKEQQLREERKWRLEWAHSASTPRRRLEQQILDERTRLIRGSINRTYKAPIGVDFFILAEEAVKKQWEEQGIWNDKWKEWSLEPWRWKHEEPLDLLDTDMETEVKTRLIYSAPKETGTNPGQPKSNEEMQLIAQQRAVQEREREASRPFHQFVYQVSKERDRIRERLRYKEATDLEPVDINTTAYENVKKNWIQNGIWNKRWGILPGISWKHEHPLDEDETPPVQLELPVGDGYITNETSPGWLDRSPSPVKVNRSQAPGILNGSEQELPAAIDGVGLQNSTANHSPLTPNSTCCFTTSMQVRLSEKRHRLRQDERAPSGEDGQNLPIINTDLVFRFFCDDEPVPLRRSKRLREARSSAEDDPTEIVLTDSLKGLAQSRPKRTAADPKLASSVKTQGISKGKRSRKTRRKVRKYG